MQMIDECVNLIFGVFFYLNENYVIFPKFYAIIWYKSGKLDLHSFIVFFVADNFDILIPYAVNCKARANNKMLTGISL